ncbi:MAG: hypothetical protein ACK5OP_01150 [Sphingobacteriales bacterium]
MTSCSTADEVARLAGSYFREGLFGGVFIFVDAGGRYAIMEPDTVWVGSDPHYVIANFCPSTTAEEDRTAFARYTQGQGVFERTRCEPGRRLSPQGTGHHACVQGQDWGWHPAFLYCRFNARDHRSLFLPRLHTGSSISSIRLTASGIYTIICH